MARPHHILFVCLGNICRSPMAEGVFRALVDAAGRTDEFVIDSAATGPWHRSKGPDRRAIDTAAGRGVDISGLRGRTIQPDDFHRFDLILGMERSNLRNLMRVRPPNARAEMRLFLEYAPDHGLEEIADPFLGWRSDFERACDLAEAAAAGLLASIPPRSAPTWRMTG